MVINPTTFQTKSWFPDYIRIDPLNDRMANAVGLSNPRARNIIKAVRDKITKKTIFSVMCVRQNKEASLKEAEEYVNIFNTHIPASIKRLVAQKTMRHAQTQFILQPNGMRFSNVWKFFENSKFLL